MSEFTPKSERLARLIVAAPEMYEWLKTIAKTFENGNVINVSGIKALLARIDGEEHEVEAQEWLTK